MNLKVHGSYVLSLACSFAAGANSIDSFYIDFTNSGGTAATVVGEAPSSFGNHSSDWSYYSNYTYADKFLFNPADAQVGLQVQGGVVAPSDHSSSASSNDTFVGGGDGVYVGRYYGGLGVGFETQPGGIDDDKHTLDASRGRDFLVLTFDTQVVLTQLDFDYFGPTQSSTDTSYADVQVFADGIEGELLFTANIPYGNGIVDINTVIGAGTTFVITPHTDPYTYTSYGRTKYKYDEFKLRSVSGYTSSQPGNTAIPSPTAMLVGAAGLASLVARRPRRRV